MNNDPKKPQPDIVFGLSDFQEYHNETNPDLIAGNLSPTSVYKAKEQIERHRFSAKEIHLHPGTYHNFLKDHAGASVGGGDPTISLGGGQLSRIMHLEPKIHTQLPMGHIYVVAEIPTGLRSPAMMDDDTKFRMIQRIVLKAPVDIEARLVSLFYQLLRDHIQPANLESVIQCDEALIWHQGVDGDGRVVDDKVAYCNPYLKDYALDIAGRLLGTRKSAIKRRRIEKALDEKKS